MRHVSCRSNVDVSLWYRLHESGEFGYRLQAARSRLSRGYCSVAFHLPLFFDLRTQASRAAKSSAAQRSAEKSREEQSRAEQAAKVTIAPARLLNSSTARCRKDIRKVESTQIPAPMRSRRSSLSRLRDLIGLGICVDSSTGYLCNALHLRQGGAVGAFPSCDLKSDGQGIRCLSLSAAWCAMDLGTRARARFRTFGPMPQLTDLECAFAFGVRYALPDATLATIADKARTRELRFVYVPSES